MITAYPVVGKGKSRDICEAFLQGCSELGAISYNPKHVTDGPAFFYGIDSSNMHVWQEVRKRAPAVPYYYCDNAYFDTIREQYFRVTKNRLQHAGLGTSDGTRLAKVKVQFRAWQDNFDGHVVVCPQSDDFMRAVAGYRGHWLQDVVPLLREKFPHNEIRIRNWSRDKTALTATLTDDLKGARLLVTWSSAAAITAALYGIRTISQSSDTAAAPMSGNLFSLATPPQLDRETWAGVLADNQWTLEEFRNGTAWKMLCQ